MIFSLLFSLLCLFLTINFLLVNGLITDGRITSNNILRYDFTRSDCLNGIFPQQAMNSQFLSHLMVNKFNGECPQSNGIQLSSQATTSAVTSSTDLSSLLSYLQNKQTFTFEFWIEAKKSNFQTTAQSLLSFSSPSLSCQPLEVSHPPPSLPLPPSLPHVHSPLGFLLDLSKPDHKLFHITVNSSTLIIWLRFQFQWWRIRCHTL
jgi:hypothetical protein